MVIVRRYVYMRKREGELKEEKQAKEDEKEKIRGRWPEVGMKEDKEAAENREHGDSYKSSDEGESLPLFYFGILLFRSSMVAAPKGMISC